MSGRQHVEPASVQRREALADDDLSVPLVDERIRALLCYWLDLRRGAEVPAAGSFDPTRVAAVLPHFWILKRDPEAGGWRFALAGEETLKLTGRKLVGESVDEVFAAQAGRFNEVLDAVASTPAVCHMIGPMYRTDSVAVLVERLALPMRTGTSVDCIYGATMYRWPHRAYGDNARYVCDGSLTVVPVATFR